MTPKQIDSELHWICKLTHAIRDVGAPVVICLILLFALLHKLPDTFERSADKVSATIVKGFEDNNRYWLPIITQQSERIKEQTRLIEQLRDELIKMREMRFK
jgi:hypothetical protein